MEWLVSVAITVGDDDVDEEGDDEWGGDDEPVIFVRLLLLDGPVELL